MITPLKSTSGMHVLDSTSAFSQAFYDYEEEVISYGEILVKPAKIGVKEVSQKQGVGDRYTGIYYINAKKRKVQSSLKIPLIKGSYDFYFLFDHQGIQYAARSTYKVKKLNNTVHFKIFPVLGETILNVRDVEKLASYKPRLIHGGETKVPAYQLKISRLKNSNRLHKISTHTIPLQVYMNLPTPLRKATSAQLR